jgi:REP element-mobilizing transposase RayT
VHYLKLYPPALLGAFRMPLAERAHIYAHNCFLTLQKVQINFARKKMSKSISTMTIHLVFSTKYRQPFILPQIENDLYGFLSKLCEELECPSIQIGGYYDHVHVMCFLSRKIAVMKLAERLKSNSSRWIKIKADFLKDFEWQLGYAVFSVGQSEVSGLKKYIQNQKSHHSEMDFSGRNRNFILQHINEPIWATSELPPAELGDEG